MKTFLKVVGYLVLVVGLVGLVLSYFQPEEDVEEPNSIKREYITL